MYSQNGEASASLLRLQQQFDFIREIDKLKQIVRRTLLLDQSRCENDAEHSWHLAMMALLLQEYANQPVDITRVVEMVLVHDLVEIDAGDTYIYDEEGLRSKAEREERAAERIFGLLPADQGARLRALWDEFEAQETADAAFALAIDRLQPLLHNYHTRGQSWRQHGISRAQVVTHQEVIAEGSVVLWDYCERLIADAVAQGFLRDQPTTSGAPAEPAA